MSDLEHTTDSGCPPYDDQARALARELHGARAHERSAARKRVRAEAATNQLTGVEAQAGVTVDAYSAQHELLRARHRRLLGYHEYAEGAILDRLGATCVARIERLLGGTASPGHEPPDDILRLERRRDQLLAELGLEALPDDPAHPRSVDEAREHYTRHAARTHATASEERRIAQERLARLETLPARIRTLQSRLEAVRRKVVATARDPLALVRLRREFLPLFEEYLESCSLESTPELIEPERLEEMLLRAWCGLRDAQLRAHETGATLTEITLAFDEREKELRRVVRELERARSRVLARMDPRQNCKVTDPELNDD